MTLAVRPPFFWVSLKWGRLLQRAVWIWTSVICLCVLFKHLKTPLLVSNDFFEVFFFLGGVVLFDQNDLDKIILNYPFD